MDDTLRKQLTAMAAAHLAQRKWRPRLLRTADGDDREELQRLIADEEVLTVCDELGRQLVGLMEVRDPGGARDPVEIAARIQSHLGETDQADYGVWVHYPWLRRLVHILPEAEYRELRNSRNRNKITFDEQEHVRALRIGIVGLSIGQAAAVTLALEEVGGYFALADFDFLELSNMNRLRTGVHNLGINKAILAAREMFEINPYLNADLWTDGVGEENLDDFLHSGGSKLDLVYEECDELHVKVLVRERARAHRIPVLMETSDRGLMDIERFDLEPNRPLFHGLAGEVRAADLRGMTTYEKVPVVMRIIGREGMSDRMAASMVDIDATLKSWPQLASEVALGAGINVDSARRIALGELTASGRFYVDIASMVSDARASQLGPSQTFEIKISEEAKRFALPPLPQPERALEVDGIRALVAWAVTAYSGGNCQPWRFVYRPGRLVVLHDRSRSASFLDTDHRASHLAFGSVIENIDLVCRALGIQATYRLFPDDRDPCRVCDIELSPLGTAPPPDDLVHYIGSRVTNRRLGERKALDPAHRERMTAAIASRGVSVQWLETPEQLAAITPILGRSDRFRMLSKRMHGEMMSEIRWGVDEVDRTRDGLDVATLELTPTDLAGMRMISSWPVMKMVGSVGGGLGLERPTRKSLAVSAAVGLVTVAGTAPEGFVAAGRALHRLWLSATRDDVAFQPMTPITYLFYRLEQMNGEGLGKAELTGLRELRADYRKLFDVPEGHAEPMLFRVGYADAPTARSIRRHADDVLQIEG